MSFLGITGGAGGLSASSSAGPSTSGDVATRTGTGNKNINIGGNPNISTVAQSPMLIAGLVVVLVAGAWFFSRRRK